MTVRKETERDDTRTTVPSDTPMTLFIISIPLMVLAVAAAVIPLIVMSHRDHLRHAAERAAATRYARHRVKSEIAAVGTDHADEALRAAA